MESVKKEPVSPMLGESGGTYDSSEVSTRGGGVIAPTTTNLEGKSNSKPPFMPSYSSSSANGVGGACALTTLANAISTTSTTTVSNGDLASGRGGPSSGGNGRATANGPSSVVDEASLEEVILAPGSNFSGDIGDAVTKILEDYDWSKIPLANKDAAGSERRKVHVKRPMNAFMVWAQEARRKLSCNHRQVHNAELSKSLGRIWRGMTEDQKRPFIERADHLRRKHKQEYPDYKYQPRRRKENVKTVSKCPQGNPVTMQDLSGNHHYVSSVKGGNLGLSLQPLSPPNSPSGQGVVKGHTDAHLGDPAVFVPDCLTDTFENIDRAEMNKYLMPDQGSGPQYATSAPHGPPTGLQPMTTMSAMSSMNTMTVPSSSNSCSGSLPSGASSSLTSLPSLGSRLLPPAPTVYGGSSSPYYTGGTSPQPPAGHVSPDLIVGEMGANSAGGVSPGGSPGSPVGDYVELQPPRVPKEEPLPPLSAPKPANVNPFLHQNLCYSTQPHPTFQYSYPYATMWY
ncbi:transcription factor SOX-8-like isoform X3 [Macrobrachium nipponense]|uniref:transcription factor SOX-8-like isoform X3 n=1 Tax=Macrobrachium nipponense TaxID=159736 RepID=UPI0030C7A1C2